MAFPESLSRGQTQSGRLMVLPTSVLCSLRLAPPYHGQGPAAFAHARISGPSTVRLAPAPSACPFLLRLRAQHCLACPCSQRLPVSTASQGPALSGLPLLPAPACFYCVSGPSTVRPAPAPSARLFLLRLRAQHCPACPCPQRLPVSTAAGYAAAGMVCPGQSAPSCDSQPWHSGRARVCTCTHALRVLMTAFWGGE